MERDARSPGADHFVDIWDDEKKDELKGLPLKHAFEYINAPSIKGSLDLKSGYTGKAGAEKEKVKGKEKSEKTDTFFSRKLALSPRLQTKSLIFGDTEPWGSSGRRQGRRASSLL
jgi:hypothetical protein